MAILSDAARQLLDSGPLAHVVTLNKDGSPQVTCTWITRDEDDTLRIAVLTLRQKIANLRRDPRIVISFEGPGKNDIELTDYLVIHGRATVLEGGAAELLQKQARLYIGPDVKFPMMDEPPPGYVLQIEIEKVWDHIGSWGNWDAPSPQFR
jgi:PPOX class probable F420-dependent enzyme